MNKDIEYSANKENASIDTLITLHSASKPKLDPNVPEFIPSIMQSTDNHVIDSTTNNTDIDSMRNISNPFTFIHNTFEQEIHSFYVKTRPQSQFIKNQEETFQFISQCISIYNEMYTQKHGTTFVKTSKPWQVFKFGGNVWKIDTIYSDLDMAIDLGLDVNVDLQKVLRYTKQHILENVGKLISELTEGERLKVQNVLHARYPIIKIKDMVTSIEIDLSIADSFCRRTTEFILQIINVFEDDYGIPVRELIVFIKHWTKKCCMNDGSRRYLNSFGYTLMIIKYLQCLVSSELFIIGNIQKLSCLLFDFGHFMDMHLMLQPKGYRY